MDNKLNKIVPEDLYRVAEIIEILRGKYGTRKAAFILEETAKALRAGKIGGGGPAREIFVSRER